MALHFPKRLKWYKKTYPKIDAKGASNFWARKAKM